MCVLGADDTVVDIKHMLSVLMNLLYTSTGTFMNQISIKISVIHSPTIFLNTYSVPGTVWGSTNSDSSIKQTDNITPACGGFIMCQPI